MNITSDTPQPSVIERIARIRQRMRVEQVTGIAAAQKEVFLPLCLESEVEYKGSVDGVARPIRSVLSADKVSYEGWADDWYDWEDR